MEIAIYRSDGGVSIMRGIDPEDVESALAAWSEIKAGEYSIESTHIVGEDVTLPEKIFRDAWEHNGGKIAVNMDKARALHMMEIRAARNAELARLDVDTMRALGRGDPAGGAGIEAQKQRLRDLPATFDLTQAKTPEELARLWPEALPRS